MIGMYTETKNNERGKSCLVCQNRYAETMSDFSPLWSGTVMGHLSTDWQQVHGPNTRVAGCDDSWGTENCYWEVTWRCQSVPDSTGTVAQEPKLYNGGYIKSSSKRFNTWQISHSSAYHTMPRTLRSSRPWEMFSAIMNPQTRCWIGPASPQCGRDTNVFNPCSLKNIKTKIYKCEVKVIWLIIKVKWFHYRPGVANRVGRGVGLLFHDHGTRRWVSGQQHPPATLYPRERPGTHCTGGWGGPQGQSGRAENLVPTGIRSRTVQPVDSHYTNWATRPTLDL